ncbi:F-box protein like [Capsicum galapagoense]
MDNVSSNDGQSNTPKQKKQSRSTKGKYLRPGALAQLHYTKVAAAKSCTYLGKKRIIVITSDETKDQAALQNDVIDKSSIFLSPMKFCYDSGNTPIDVSKQNKLQRTPKTPGASECIAESRLESLPTNLLV